MNRWIITGTLDTRSPLHVGDGSTVHRPELKVKDAQGNERLAEVNGVAVDIDGRPSIPGTALKSLLRRAMVSAAIDIGTIDRLLGSSDNGGRVEFRFARMPAAWTAPVGWQAPPYWSESRRTGVKASTAVDRRSRTVLEHRLYHTEYVPAGLAFSLEMIGHDLTTTEVGQILGSLDLVRREGSDLSVGAGASTSWGRVEATGLTCMCLDAAGLKEWLASDADATSPGDKPTWCDFAKVPSGVADLEIRSARSAVTNSASRLTIPLVLQFDGAFLTSGERQQPGEGQPNAVPLLDSEGRLWLPGESLKGALRSQAERILRTVRQPACMPDKSCDAPSEIAELDNVCLACCLFGVTGWGAPLQVGHFVSASVQTFTQDFVAIDRFTGGGSVGGGPGHATDGSGTGGRKFKVRAAWAPRLAGIIQLDISRLLRTNRAEAAIGLLAYVLRDLEEGDVQVGAKRSVGYGACRATGTDWRELLESSLPGTTTLAQCLQAFGALPPAAPEVGNG